MFRRFLAAIVGIMVCINLLWVPPIQGAGDNSLIRVKLASMGSPKSVNVYVNGNYGVPQIDKNNILAKGNYTVRVESGKLVLDDKTGSKTVSTTLGSSFTFKRYRGASSNYIKIGNYNYQGDMQVRLNGSSIELINHVHLETYLYGVVPYEVSNSWPIELQKAQAVAARTYAVSKRKPSSAYDVVDTTTDQVYRGYNGNYKNSIKAVDDTFGQVLKYGSSYAGTYYSASNGGMIESTKNLWGSDLAYSKVKEDPYDLRNESNPYRSWTVTYKKKPVDSGLLSRLKFQDALKNKGLKESDIENLEIKEFSFEYNSSTRADKGKVVLSMNKKQDPPEDETPPEEIEPPEEILITFNLTKGNIRSILDLRSLLFKVEDKGDSFVFKGSGWGHGIGMSQYGAQQMAKEGKSYKEILDFYYPGTKLTDLGIESDKGGDPMPDPKTDPKPDPDPDPDPNPGNETKQQFGRVNVSTSLNVRQGAGTSYKKIGSLYKGDRVEILDRSGAWYKIKKGSLQGYVHGDYIVLEDNGQSSPPPASGQDPKPGKTDPAPPPSDEKRYGRVTASALNVRSGPSTKNHIVGMVVKGTKLTILATQGDWYRISFNGKDGYVHANYVKLETSDNTTPPPSNNVIGKATVTASSLNVRNGASTSNKKIGSLAKGKQVELLEKVGAWYKIKYGSGTGYVHGDYLKLISGSESNRGTEQRTGTVTASSLNVRTGPGTKYSRVGLLYRGAKVTITGESGSWYQIKSGSLSGYVSKSYIKL
jgi:SpoIID/LytB domain protein